MSWEEFDLENMSTDAELLPAADYVFELVNGAKAGKWDAEAVEAVAKVAEGEFKGRVAYFSYPNPAKQDWSPAAFKRLEVALVKNGARPISKGEKPVPYLNDPEVIGHKFIAPISHREVTNNESGEKSLKSDLKLFKVRPAA